MNKAERKAYERGWDLGIEELRAINADLLAALESAILWMPRDCGFDGCGHGSCLSGRNAEAAIARAKGTR